MAEPRRERKVVTVLFADLVGFTARSEQLDPEDVDAVLRPYHERLRAELERWGGTVEKFIGDAVVAVFGAPVAREDDPERALRAALAIRDWAIDEDGVEVRIAVNTGEALVSLDARPDSGEGMVAGDVVNTASRLQSAAPVNGILVGEQTQRATERVIDYRDAEPVVAKGKTEPSRSGRRCRRARASASTCASTAARSSSAASASSTSLVRRARARAAGARAAARDARRRAGIGKSRLVCELFGRRARRPGWSYWRQGRSLPYGEGVSFWALAEMVKAQAGILEGDDADDVETKLAAPSRASSRTRTRTGSRRARPLVGLAQSGAASARSRSPPGGRSSRRSPTSARSCSSSRTCTGRTRGCSTSSTTSWTGRPAYRCCSSAPHGPSCSSVGRAGAAASGTRSRSTSRRSPRRTPQLLSARARPRRAARRDAAGAARARERQPALRGAVRAHLPRARLDRRPRAPETVHGLIAARLDASRRRRRRCSRTPP